MKATALPEPLRKFDCHSSPQPWMITCEPSKRWFTDSGNHDRCCSDDGCRTASARSQQRHLADMISRASRRDLATVNENRYRSRQQEVQAAIRPALTDEYLMGTECR
jgi:hypothetical protein